MSNRYLIGQRISIIHPLDAISTAVIYGNNSSTLSLPDQTCKIYPEWYMQRFPAKARCGDLNWDSIKLRWDYMYHPFYRYVDAKHWSWVISSRWAPPTVYRSEHSRWTCTWPWRLLSRSHGAGCVTRRRGFDMSSVGGYMENQGGTEFPCLYNMVAYVCTNYRWITTV